MTSDAAPFWDSKPLDALSPDEWEALCDGCGKCCLHKMIDEDGALLETNVACRLLDLESVRCQRYNERKRFVPDCTVLTAQNASSFDWLPRSCAYVLRAQGKPLPAWHHLRTGSYSAMHDGGHSVKGRIISERDAGPLEHHIIDGCNQQEGTPHDGA